MRLPHDDEVFSRADAVQRRASFSALMRPNARCARQCSHAPRPCRLQKEISAVAAAGSGAATASMVGRDQAQAPMLSREQQNMESRAIDPTRDDHVRAIVHYAGSSCCHD